MLTDRRAVEMIKISLIQDSTKSIVMLAHKYLKEPFNLLELFAGNGSENTKYLAKYCNKVAGWDINPVFEKDFKATINGATFTNRNSVEFLECAECNDFSEVNIISIDNPTGLFYENQYCEHFEIINNVWKLVGTRAIVAVNILLEVDMVDTLWKKRRVSFYGTSGPLNFDKISNVYKNVFELQKLNILESSYICRELTDGRQVKFTGIFAVEKL